MERANVLVSQVEAFIEVARQRNLSRAAEALHVTQPGLSARLQGLERELRVALFDRSRRGMELTSAGRAFLPYAERAMDSLQAGQALLGEHASGLAGELAIGAAPAVGTYVLPRLLKRFVRDYPAVRLVVRTGHSEEIVDLVAARELEVGLVREIHRPGVALTPLYEDELLLVVPPGHEFARAGRIEVERLSAATLILFDRTSSYYDATSAVFREAGVVPRGRIELDNIDAAKQMVAHGLGVALLPHTAVAGDIARGVLRAIEIVGLRPIRRQIFAARRAGQAVVSPAAVGFLEVLDQIDELLPGRGTILA
jgi:DNA-binding transcriptional LysR family regulator